MSFLRGGPLDGSEVAMSDDEMDLSVAWYEPALELTTLYRYHRDVPGADLVLQEDG